MCCGSQKQTFFGSQHDDDVIQRTHASQLSRDASEGLLDDPRKCAHRLACVHAWRVTRSDVLMRPPGHIINRGQRTDDIIQRSHICQRVQNDRRGLLNDPRIYAHLLACAHARSIS